jgi:hypothetical protein
MAIVLDGTSGITTPALDSTARFATADMPLGSVLQVVQGTSSASTTLSSSTFADTGLTATITPTSATSKILVLVNHTGCGKETNDTWLYLRLLRGATAIADIERFGGYTGAGGSNFVGSVSSSYLDAPATTAATTYKTQLASANNNAAVYVQTGHGGIEALGTITLMEIAA